MLAIKLSALVMASVAVVVLGFACGGDSDDVENGEPNGSEPTVGPQLLDQPAPAQGVDSEAITPSDGVVDIVMADVVFQQNNVQIPLGEPILIRVTNSDLVVHNLRIAGLDGQFMTEDDAVTDPSTIAVGDGGELTFAPPVAGAYTFQCDFHPTTMGGVIVVQ
ncbi:MAG: cupredoxin domain-containing protein [Chloroflexi bacterium]|nr:cupredoxin domain-containing protein [Chloroflexota bacterium]